MATAMGPKMIAKDVRLVKGRSREDDDFELATRGKICRRERGAPHNGAPHRSSVN